MGRQDLEQAELTGGERDRRIAAQECAGGEVEQVRPERDLAIGSRRARGEAFGVASKHRVDARDQLARIERFRQVIICSHLEPNDPVHVLAFGGEHDDRHRFSGPAQASADPQAVFARKHEVEDEQVRRVTLKPLVELACVGEGLDLEALLREITDEQIAQTRIVIDHQNLGIHVLHRNRIVGRGAISAERGL